MNRNATVIALAVLVLVLGVWVYKAYEKNATRTAVLSAVKDTGERLRAVVTATSDDGIDYEAHARAAEAHAAALRNRDTSAVRALADAADDYLVTAREILKRRAAMQASRESVAKSLQAFTEHMQSDRGRAAWTQQAVDLRVPLERDLREYRIASESYAALLESLPASQMKIAPFGEAAVLLDPKAVKAAQTGALDALARTDENIRRVSRLEPYRGETAAARR
jgi:hypothetical protein